MNPNLKVLETKRLILRKFELGDAPFIVGLLNSPGFLQFIGDRKVRTLADAETYLNNGILKNYNFQNFGLWQVVLKTNNLPIGMCGLIKRPGLEHVDLGFAFMPAHIRKGYAYEAAHATLHYAKTTLSITNILAITDLNNVASINLLNKLGFSFEKTIQLPNSEETLNLFAWIDGEEKARL